MNSLLVIIVSYNSMPWAERCYNSLRASTVPCDVITIDNGSTDGTVDYIRKNYPEVEIIESEVNLGFGQANNIALRKALRDGYDYVYLLNQDAWVETNTFEALIKAAEAHPEYGVLSPMQMQGNNEFFDTNFKHLCLDSIRRLNTTMLDDFYCGRINTVYEVNDVMAAHWLITKHCLQTVGGFSPTFFHYGEDDNYLHRVKYFGMKVAIVTNSRAVHDRADRIKTLEFELYIKYYVNKLKKLSNPLSHTSFFSQVRKFWKRALFNKDRIFLDYSKRLIKERKQIADNRKRSLERGAFL